MRIKSVFRAIFVVCCSFAFSLFALGLTACMTPSSVGDDAVVENSENQAHPSGLSPTEILAIKEAAANDWGVPPEEVHIGDSTVSVSDMAVKLSFYVARIQDTAADGTLSKPGQRRHLFDCQVWWCSDERTIDQETVSLLRVYVSTAALIPYVDQAIDVWNKSGAEIRFRRVTSGGYDTHVYETGSLSCGSSTAIGCADYPTAGDPGQWVQIRNDWQTWPSYWGGVAKVLIHEFGHTLSLSHTDVNEQYSRHIEGTPDYTDTYSIMNSTAGSMQTFTYWDMMAARILYPLDKDQALSHLGDVNGDGRKDLILIGDNGITVALQTVSGTFQQPTLWSDEFSKWRGWNSSYHRFFADVTGDGKTDVIGFGANDVVVAVSTGSGFAVSNWSNDFGTADGYDEANTVKMIGDVTGDGKADLVAISYNDVIVRPSTGSSFSGGGVWHTDHAYNDGWTKAYTLRTLADVTGDGKLDLVAIGTNDVIVRPSTGTSFATGGVWHTDHAYNDGWTHDYTPRLFADVTGDGKADLVGFGLNQVIVRPSTGASFATGGIWSNDFGHYDGWTNTSTRRTLADVTGDGKADFVGYGINDVIVVPSTGSSFAGGGAWHSSYATNDGWGAATPRLLGDMNNDGKVDMVNIGFNEFYINLSSGSNFGTTLGLQYRTY